MSLKSFIQISEAGISSLLEVPALLDLWPRAKVLRGLPFSVSMATTITRPIRLTTKLKVLRTMERSLSKSVKSVYRPVTINLRHVRKASWRLQ